MSRILSSRGGKNNAPLNKLTRLDLLEAGPQGPVDKYIASMTKLRRPIAVLLFFFFCTQTSGNSPAPFQTLQFSIQIVEPAKANSLHGYWDPERGLEARIITPFYWGEIYAGGQIKSFSGADPSYPDFESIYPFLGWGISLPLPFQFRLHPGFYLGIDRMEFDTLTGFERTESEVGLTVLVEICKPLSLNWTLRSSIRQESIFTYERIHLLQLSAGLGYTIRTPRAIKKVLE